jgi:hypothetical protein
VTLSTALRTQLIRALTILGGVVLLFVVVVAGWYWKKKLHKYPESTISQAQGEQIFQSAVFENHEAEGVPYWIWKVMPEMFPQTFKPDYAELGLIRVAGRDLPLGMNKSRRFGIEWVTHNCALCHAAAYRATEASEQTVVMGMPNAFFRRQIYVEGLDKAYMSDAFTPDAVLTAIEKQTVLPAAEKPVYREWVGKLRERAIDYKNHVGTTRDWHPLHAPGQAEGFGAAKQYAGVFDETIGTADFPSTFMQRPRVIGHWDGISTSTLERVIGSALAIGAKGSAIDMQQMLDIDKYTMDLKPPPYPLTVDTAKAQRGGAVFQRECANCHAASGARINTIVPLTEVKTDPHRQKSLYVSFLWRIKLGTLPSNYPFQHWQSSDGYRSDFLEGLFTRGPYLHNGSVPSIRDLLKPAAERPKKFMRGTNVLDAANLGYRSDAAAPGNVFEYDTSREGYSNAGHEYGTALPEAQKDELVEYLKTL